MIDQFIMEAKIQTFIDHPNIVKLFGMFDDENKIYLILQYCEGGNLFNSLKGITVFSQSLTKKYVSQIAEGIDCLQDNQIFHRDLKPENIVLAYVHYFSFRTHAKFVILDGLQFLKSEGAHTAAHLTLWLLKYYKDSITINRQIFGLLAY